MKNTIKLILGVLVVFVVMWIISSCQEPTGKCKYVETKKESLSSTPETIDGFRLVSEKEMGRFGHCWLYVKRDTSLGGVTFVYWSICYSDGNISTSVTIR